MANLIRSTCVRVATSAMFYSGACSFIRQNRRRISSDGSTERENYSFAVLLYHRVNPDNDRFFPAVSVKAFDAQMRYLAENYNVLPLGEIVERIRLGRGVGPQTIAITFDDGYRDNYLYAHAILRRYNLPATLFVATSYLGTGKRMWNDEIASAVKHTSQKWFTLRGAAQPVSLASVPEKLAALEQILESLKTLTEFEKKHVAKEIVQSLDQRSPKVEPLMLSWTELRTLAQEGWEVGSHTVNHVILTRVPLSTAKDEIISSASVLQKELNQRVRLFAYPNGKSNDYDSSIKEALSEAGYIGAVTTVDRLNSEDADCFEIGRKSPWDEWLPGFALKLDWSYWRQNRSLRQTSRQLFAS